MQEVNFKHTEIGLIPHDWDYLPISQLAQDMSDGPFGSNLKTEHYTTEHQVRVIQLSNIGETGWADDNCKYTTFEHAKTLQRCIAPYGCILVAKMMPAGRSILCPDKDIKYILGSDVVKIIPNNLLNAKYFVYQTKSNYYLAQIQANTQGSTRQRTSISKLRNIFITLPPTTTEQERIADALSKIDGLIADLDALIEKKRAIKLGAMRKLLERNDIEPILLDELVKNGDIKLYRGKVISKKDIEACPGDYPIYSSSVQNNGLMGCYGKYMFDEEMISWSVDGGGNFFYRPKHKFSITNVSGYMRINRDKYDYQFLAYLLQHEHAKKVFDYQTKAHPSVIRMAYELKIPNISEQREIASILSGMDTEIAVLEQKRDKYTAIKQGMMQNLLTGKIRLV